MPAVTLRAGARGGRVEGLELRLRQRWSWWQRRAPSPRQRNLWLRQMALLLRAGVPLLTALDSARPAAAGEVAQAWARLRTEVEAGAGLAQSMERQPQLFDHYSVRMIACAELTGTLDTALERIAAQHERADAVRRTLRRALVYPSVVAGVAGAAMAVLLIFVVPVFGEIFAEQGEALPWPTQVVIQLSRLSTIGIPLGLVLMLGLGLVLPWLLQRPVWRARIDGLLLRLPLFGPIVRATATARAADSLASLIAGGVPLLEALVVGAETVGNVTVSDSLRHARLRVSDGRSLSAALGADAVWPDLAVQLIAIGETTGGLETMLARAGDLLREEGEQRVNLLLALLEPAIVVGLAVGVGGLVVAMYLPVFRLGAFL